MFTFATVAVGLMYGGGFFITAKTHLTVMEYWRWWVVHLWVEGFFEVFATAAIAADLRAARPRAALARGRRGHRVERPVPVRRHSGHLPPPVLQRHAHLHHGGRRHVQRAGGDPAGADRPRGVPDQPHAIRGAVDAALPLADPLLRGRRLLEPRWRRHLRVPDQPADRALLHAGPQHDARPRAHGALRRLRPALARPRAGDGAAAHPRARVAASARSRSRSGA